MFYEAVAADDTRSIGLAVSKDGKTEWQRLDRSLLKEPQPPTPRTPPTHPLLAFPIIPIICREYTQVRCEQH